MHDYSLIAAKYLYLDDNVHMPYIPGYNRLISRCNSYLETRRDGKFDTSANILVNDAL